MAIKITRHIPNTITLLNLLSGVLASVCAIHGTEEWWCGMPAWQWAMILIGAAAVFDFLDGAAARLLGAYSELGKQLDSLSDMVSFGVAPTLLVLVTMLDNGSGWLSYSALLIAAMGALRLAKFNIDTRQTTSFIGLPIPASAIFWIGLVGWIHGHWYPGTAPVVLMVIVVSLLMVSGVKMFSLKFKTWGWRENFRRYVLLLAAVIFCLTQGIAGLAWTIVLYILISLVGRKQG